MCEDLSKGKQLLEAWQKARMQQLQIKQQKEVEALLQRSCLQRDELERELKRKLDLHDKRCNAVVAVSLQTTAPLSQFLFFFGSPLFRDSIKHTSTILGQIEQVLGSTSAKCWLAQSQQTPHIEHLFRS